ncbi:MFS transporter, partial [Leptospira borgpetersenii serovar Hardjo-bovis]|nr:MFS transporter [Leptospira borgpetersenii serovar Hardjo-bovis]
TAEENGAPPDARAGKTAEAGAGAAAGTAAADGARSGAAPDGARSGAGRQAQVGVVLAAVFITYVGQSTLNPVIAPLSRLVGLKEWQIGLTISVAALMVVLPSQAWVKRSQSMGRKPVLVIALAVAAVSMGVFALVSHLGVTGALSGAPLFALFVIVRGVVFGAALAAVLPTAQ